MTERPHRINIISHDASFARILVLEAERMDIDATVSVTPLEGYTVYVVDLDHGAPMAGDPNAYIVFFSRRESCLAQIPKTARTTALLRPFSMHDFRTLLSQLFLSIEIKKAKKEQSAKPIAWILDQKNKTLSLGTHAPIFLTESECRIMDALLSRRGCPLGKAEGALLLEESGSSNRFEVHICSLRKKIAACTDQKLIYTLRGQGYYVK